MFWKHSFREKRSTIRLLLPNLNVNHFTTGAGMVLVQAKFLRKRDFQWNIFSMGDGSWSWRLNTIFMFIFKQSPHIVTELGYGGGGVILRDILGDTTTTTSTIYRVTLGKISLIPTWIMDCWKHTHTTTGYCCHLLRERKRCMSSWIYIFNGNKNINVNSEYEKKTMHNLTKNSVSSFQLIMWHLHGLTQVHIAQRSCNL